MPAQDREFRVDQVQAGTVAAKLETHVNQQLRFGYYEEALVSALKALAAFDGKVSPKDQVRLDEVIARCLHINHADPAQAAARYQRAYRLRTDTGTHRPADSELSSLHPDMPSVFRLLLGEAECHLMRQDHERAAEVLAPLVAAPEVLLGTEFSADLQRYLDEHRKPVLERNHDLVHRLSYFLDASCGYLQALEDRPAAEKHAANWRKRGLPSGVLWIPDYASLGGAKLYLTYVGPWPYSSGRAEALAVLKRDVVPHHEGAYGIRIDQTKGRETLR